jgi:hypothetical protein
MQDDKASVLRRGGDQQVGHFSAMLAAARKQSLNLTSPLHMTRICLHQAKRQKRRLKRIPLARVSSRIADLEVGDA